MLDQKGDHKDGIMAFISISSKTALQGPRLDVWQCAKSGPLVAITADVSPSFLSSWNPNQREAKPKIWKSKLNSGHKKTNIPFSVIFIFHYLEIIKMEKKKQAAAEVLEPVYHPQ